MSESTPRLWWAPDTGRARRSAVSAIALTICLAGASYFVWTSPSSPISVASRTPVAAAPSAVEERLVTQREELRAQVAQLRVQLAQSEAGLRGANDTNAAATAQVAALNTQLAQTTAAAAAAEAARVQASARADTAEASATASAAAAQSSKKALELATATQPASVPAPAQATSPAAAPAAPATGPAPQAISTPTLAQIVQPDSRYFGLYTPQAPFNWATYDDTARKIGSAPNVVGYFSGWDESFRANAVTSAWSRGRMPVMTWESRPIGAENGQEVEPDYELNGIIEGKHDDYLRQYARDIVATGLPLAIRFDHEMNGDWYPWSESTSDEQSLNGNSPGEYVAMWRHVHNIFAQEGANAFVAWIWAPNIVNNLADPHKTPQFLAALYPGDDYVDWVGLSGYLRPPFRDGNNFTFDYTFGPSLAQLRSITTKPIFLAEVGATELGGHKAQWISSVFDALAREENNDIIGFAWFNLVVTSTVRDERVTNDWRIDSHADTLQAFVDGIHSPNLNLDLKPAP